MWCSKASQGAEVHLRRHVNPNDNIIEGTRNNDTSDNIRLSDNDNVNMRRVNNTINESEEV